MNQRGTKQLGGPQSIPCKGCTWLKQIPNKEKKRRRNGKERSGRPLLIKELERVKELLGKLDTNPFRETSKKKTASLEKDGLRKACRKEGPKNPIEHQASGVKKKKRDRLLPFYGCEKNSACKCLLDEKRGSLQDGIAKKKYQEA